MKMGGTCWSWKEEMGEDMTTFYCMYICMRFSNIKTNIVLNIVLVF